MLQTLEFFFFFLRIKDNFLAFSWQRNNNQKCCSQLISFIKIIIIYSWFFKPVWITFFFLVNTKSLGSNVSPISTNLLRLLIKLLNKCLFNVHAYCIFTAHSGVSLRWKLCFFVLSRKYFIARIHSHSTLISVFTINTDMNLSDRSSTQPDLALSHS